MLWFSVQIYQKKTSPHKLRNCFSSVDICQKKKTVTHKKVTAITNITDKWTFRMFPTRDLFSQNFWHFGKRLLFHDWHIYHIKAQPVRSTASWVRGDVLMCCFSGNILLHTIKHPVILFWTTGSYLRSNFCSDTSDQIWIFDLFTTLFTLCRVRSKIFLFSSVLFLRLNPIRGCRSGQGSKVHYCGAQFSCPS